MHITSGYVTEYNFPKIAGYMASSMGLLSRLKPLIHKAFWHFGDFCFPPFGSYNTVFTLATRKQIEEVSPWSSEEFRGSGVADNPTLAKSVGPGAHGPIGRGGF